MIIIDKALQQRQQQNQPIRVGIVGAGYMGRALAFQIEKATTGMIVAVIYNRTAPKAVEAYQAAGRSQVAVAQSFEEMEQCIAQGAAVVASEPEWLCRSTHIDAIVEVTGTIEFAAQVALEAIAHQKHVILFNAELDATLGPVLKTYADQAGVIITNVDGDQPGATMNLLRSVSGMGLRPVLCGNIKGLLDHYRTPATQVSFAAQWGQSPQMVCSFADGSKISFEQAVVANATGMKVVQRGMLGPVVTAGTPVDQAVNWYPTEALMNGPGLVDYVVGASPGPGIFVLATCPEESQRKFLDLFKMGPGPIYCFYTPYHLCHFEVPFTIARAVLFSDAAVAPLQGPVVGVVATAKTDLKAGQVLDGIGGYTHYGQCDNWEQINRQGLLLQGLAEGCRILRDVARDQVLCTADVVRPPRRTIDRLEAEQIARFA